MHEEESEARFLYRFEYYEPEDNDTYVDWVWLADDEVDEYRSGSVNTKMRRATEDESELYDEAYADGYGVAALLEFESRYDGVTFRVELNKDGDLDFEGKKMFQCSVCNAHKDFEDSVAMANGFFVATVLDDILWHVCYECAMISLEVDGIEIEFTEEGEADS
tara:strand:+ start:2679 stop:3167 length:489 start_codon:yes stop_codon:yes gene_type:complete